MGKDRELLPERAVCEAFVNEHGGVVDSTICAVTTRPDAFASSGLLSRKVCITVELGSEAIGSRHLAVTV